MSQSATPQKIGPILKGLANMTFVGWLLGTLCICLALALAYRFGYIDLNVWRYRLADLLSKQEFINPQELVPPSMKFHSLRRLDLDGDGEMERVLFYRYDLVSGRSPYGAIVLDLNNCRPRGIDSYELIPIDRDYLSESVIDIELRDIPNVGGSQEVLIWGKSPDNVRTELAIFQWYDYSQPCSPPAPGQRGYWNLGFFRGTGGIRIDGSRVHVKDRAFERSQLAVTRVYEPVSGSYRQSPDGPMLDPVSKAVEFTFTPPTPAPQTYYPEKSVLAFYLAIGLNTAEAKEYLAPDAAARYIDGNYGRDVAEPGQLTSMAEVKEIAYFPDVEKERRHERIAVEVVVVNRRPDGSITGPFRYRVWVEGVPKKGAFPYDCEWRIVGFEPM
ncbi:MAG: hypothetical protein ACUVT1_06535 [Anaerolineae bacterium]